MRMKGSIIISILILSITINCYASEPGATGANYVDIGALERRDEDEINYFAYGSNMDVQRMKSREIVFSKRYHAILPGYRLEFNKITLFNQKEGYANIVVDKNEYVEGVLYNIDDVDLEKLDCFEGYPDHYNRITIKVRLDNQSEVEAITYIAQPDKTRRGLKPSKKYLNYLLAAKNILSREYYKKLETWETLD